MTENEKIAIGRYAVEQFLNTMVHSDLNQDELMHYGRKGMKWYQHIFGAIDPRAKYKDQRYSIPDDMKPPFKSASESNEALKKRIEFDKKHLEDFRQWSKENPDKREKEYDPTNSFGKNYIDNEMARKSGEYRAYQKEPAEIHSKGFKEWAKRMKDLREEWSKALAPYIKDREKKFSDMMSFLDRREDLWDKSPEEASRDKEYSALEKMWREADRKVDEVSTPYWNRQEKLYLEGAGVVLKDLGYYDTPEAREIIAKKMK